MDSIEKLFLYYDATVVQTCFLAEPLLSNGCCIAAYFAVYMPTVLIRRSSAFKGLKYYSYIAELIFYTLTFQLCMSCYCTD
jgi:hypothetical protein